MTLRRSRRRPFSFLAALSIAFLGSFWPAQVHADPSRYPEFAQQTLPDDIKPEFITIDELVKTLQAGSKPVIIDVRTAEEFHEVHILGAVSAPLAEFKDYLKSIPRDRPVVLY
ncbi:MAG TPA: rhodanese-like domain-containing protein [Candidatus Binatia bacterium]|nr:rhodanese-like domain-containing protein [Candidatus Binatia bacterium]